MANKLKAAAIAAASLFVGTAASAEDIELNVETLADGLTHPWGMAFMPDGNILVRPHERHGLNLNQPLNAPSL